MCDCVCALEIDTLLLKDAAMGVCVLQCVSAYYNVLQCVVVCCNVLQCGAVCCSMVYCVVMHCWRQSMQICLAAIFM